MFRGITLWFWGGGYRGFRYVYIYMGLSENRVYSQWNSHLIGIMISKTIGFRGTSHFQTPPYVHRGFVEWLLEFLYASLCTFRCTKFIQHKRSLLFKPSVESVVCRSTTSAPGSNLMVWVMVIKCHQSPLKSWKHGYIYIWIPGDDSHPQNHGCGDVIHPDHPSSHGTSKPQYSVRRLTTLRSTSPVNLSRTHVQTDCWMLLGKPVKALV